MVSKKSQELENESKPIKNFKKIAIRFENYRMILKKWIFLYVFIYSCWVVAASILLYQKTLREYFKVSGLKLLLTSLAAVFRGILFSLDGFITAQLKTPFGQICYFINKSEEIEEEDKDRIISQITESNEHCKETFKKFGVLTIANEVNKVCRTLKKDEKKSEENKGWEDFLSDSVIPLLSYGIPLIFAFSRIRAINRNLEKTWNLLNSLNTETTTTQVKKRAKT